MNKEEKEWNDYLNQLIKESGRGSRGFFVELKTGEYLDLDGYNRWIIEMKENYNNTRVSDIRPKYKLEFEFSTDYHHFSNGKWKIKDLNNNTIETYSPFEREKAIKRRDELNGT